MSSPAEIIVPPVLPERLIPASAGFWIRALARIIDIVYGIVLGFVSGIFAGILLAILDRMGKMTPGWKEQLHATSYTAYGLGILGYFLYHTFSEGICGTTVGKLACGLSVVQTDGCPCTMGGAFKRDLAYHWDALFFGLIGYVSMKDSPLQQRYGDVWGKTVVVRESICPPSPPNPAWRFAAGITLGSVALLLCQFASLFIKIL